MSQTNEERNARRRERYEENKRIEKRLKESVTFTNYLKTIDSARDVLEFYFEDKYGVMIEALEEDVSFLMEAIDSLESNIERRIIVREAEALLVNL